MSVLIAVPCYGGWLSVGTFQSLIGILDKAIGDGIQVDFLVVSGEAAITRGRSNLATTFLKTNYQTLAMIDADITIDAKDFFRMLRLRKPIRGAAVCLKTEDHSELLNVFKGGERLKRKDMPPTPFEVDLLGGAVMLVEREVFEKLGKIEWLQFDDPSCGKGVHYFHEMIKDGTLMTEDFAFVIRARECGFEAWCDPRVIVGHSGPCVWYG